MLLASQRKRILAGIMVCMLSGQLSAMNPWQRIATASTYVQAFHTARQFWQTRSKTTKAVAISAVLLYMTKAFLTYMVAHEMQKDSNDYDVFGYSSKMVNTGKKHLLLIGHGLGGHKKEALHGYVQVLSQDFRKDTDIVAFNFADHTENKPFDFKLSSLAQWTDMVALLKMLYFIADKGMGEKESISFIMPSRAAGTLINTLAVLKLILTYLECIFNDK